MGEEGGKKAKERRKDGAGRQRMRISEWMSWARVLEGLGQDKGDPHGGDGSAMLSMGLTLCLFPAKCS